MSGAGVGRVALSDSRTAGMDSSEESEDEAALTVTPLDHFLFEEAPRAASEPMREEVRRCQPPAPLCR